MTEGLQRLRSRRGCSVVLTAALVAAVFIPGFGRAQARPASDRERLQSVSTHTHVAALRSHGEARRANKNDGTANTVTIIAGNASGTYLAIAHDLSVVLDDGGDFRVLPIVGKGGVKNLSDVLDRNGIDLGIIQSNILNRFRHDETLGKIDQKITYITKLHNEEMHLVVRAGSGITAIDQLDGRKVNFSESGSGTELSARDVFARLGIKPVAVNLDQADALKELEAGTIAATVLIAGKPAGLFTKVKAADGFRLLPVPFAKQLQADYLPAKLTSRDYPNLIAPGHPVDTIATGAVLIAYDWPRNSAPYRRIAGFVERFFPRLSDLQQPPRHPKWKETNLAAVLPGWQRFPAAEEWLKRHRPAATSALDQREQFNRFLKTHPHALTKEITPEDGERLYQEFLQWNEAREKRR